MLLPPQVSRGRGGTVGPPQIDGRGLEAHTPHQLPHQRSRLRQPHWVIDPAPGCRFRWRGPLAIDTCAQVTPALAELRPGHDAACHVAQTSAEEVKAPWL